MKVLMSKNLIGDFPVTRLAVLLKNMFILLTMVVMLVILGYGRWFSKFQCCFSNLQVFYVIVFLFHFFFRFILFRICLARNSNFPFLHRICADLLPITAPQCLRFSSGLLEINKLNSFKCSTFFNVM